jgi:hypothetical protein
MAKISLKTLAKDYGYSDTMEFIENECADSVVPALCDEGCEVEPDGCCEHGCPSPLIALGII